MELVLVASCDIDQDIERALLYDKGEQAARLSQGLEAANRIIESFVLSSHGRMLSQEGSNWSAQIPAEYLEELPAIVEQYEQATEARLHIGVGAEASEAVVARRIAEERGGQPSIVLYTPDLSDEARELDEVSDKDADAIENMNEGDDEVDDMAKAEDNQREGGEATQIASGQLSPSAATPSPPPSPSISAGSPGEPQQPPQGAPQGQPSEEEVLGAIGQALTQFKAQVPFFEQQVKAANPQAYAAVMGMVQGLIALAQHVAGPGEAQPQGGGQEAPPMQKAEESKVELDPNRSLPPMEALRKLYDSTVTKGEVSPSDERFHEFVQGFQHEAKEHPHLDANQAALTAKQHLAEDPQYYSKLGALEDSGVIGEGSAPLDKASVFDAAHVVKHLRATDSTGDDDFLDSLAESVGQHPQWQLGPVPVKHIDSDAERNPKTIAYYASMPACTAPPVVVVPRVGPGKQLWSVLDGGHRTQAAQARGDKTVMAYSPLNKVVLPVGSRGVGAKANSVKVLEPVTGKATWHGMGSGRKMSGDGHALSTIVGECPSADSPEHRAQAAGLVGVPTTAQEKPPQTAQLPGK